MGHTEHTLQRVPSGKLTKSYRQWPTEIVDLPINSMVIFHSYVSLPEGNGKMVASQHLML